MSLIVIPTSAIPLISDQSIHEIILNLLPEYDAKRGDIIILGQPEYRNLGRYIYDGTKLLPLDTSQDDNGNIPPIFHIGDEFYANTWINSIEHNSIVWVDTKKYGQQILDNLKKRESSFTAGLGTFTIYLDCSFMELINRVLNNNVIPLWATKSGLPEDNNDRYTLWYPC